MEAFRREDEASLAYIFGKKNKSPELKHLHESKIKWSGIFFQILKICRFVFLRGVIKDHRQPAVNVIFYAGTDNQLKALISTISSITTKDLLITTYIDREVSCRESKEIEGCVQLNFSPTLVIVAFLLLCIRAPIFYIKLRRSGGKNVLERHFNIFCRSFYYVPFFIKKIQEGNPDLVVVANDHNVDTRSMKLAAEILKVPTAYLQHASVSNIFPPLEFDYAFLDGKVAMKRYIECYKLWQTDASANYASEKVNIFLSGQKKRLNLETTPKKEFAIGIGVNAADQFDALLTLLNSLARKDIPCIIRTHPNQSQDFIEALEHFIKNNSNFQHSCSVKSDLSTFFKECSILIAANTGLHLEAALAGIPTYYHEFSTCESVSDYYGFVESGISNHLPREFKDMGKNEILGLLATNENRQAAIQEYSTSFGTIWQNQEGDLVAETIRRIINGDEFSSIYERLDESACFKQVFDLISNTKKTPA